VQDQGDLSTCAAISFAVSLTIQEARLRKLTNTEAIQKLLFSPAYVYTAAKAIEDTDCTYGLVIHKVTEGIKDYGLVRHSAVGSACLQEISSQLAATAFKKGLPDFNRFNLNLFEMRRAIADGNPVVVAIDGNILGKSFMDLRTDLWTVDKVGGQSNMGHCMVVVGYDDNKHGGAFEVMNSYGKGWGAQGYAWIKYDDLLKNIKYAVEVPPLSQVPPLAELPALDTTRGQIVVPVPPTTVVNKFEGRIRLAHKQKALEIVPAAQEQVNHNRGAGTRPLTQNSHFIATQPVTYGSAYQVIMKNNAPCYIYILNYDSRNKVDILFPKNNVSARMGAQDQIILPDAGTEIYFDDNKGTDYACFLFSKEALDLPKLQADLEKSEGVFLERLEKVLGDKLATTKAGHVRYGLGEGDLKLETLSDKSVMPLIIEFEHK
jgi:hypothetical protein